MPKEPFEKKYRPKKLSEVVGQDIHVNQLIPQVEAVKEAVKKLSELYKKLETAFSTERDKITSEITELKKIRIRHQIFAGPAGVGKTTIAEAVGREIYGDEFGQHFFEYNGSDERSIEFVRTKLKSLASKGTGRFPFNTVLIDEADGMTNDAQQAEKRIVETSTKLVFFLTCNRLGEIIPELKSRCTVRKFSNIDMKTSVNLMESICEKENITFEDGFLEELYLSRAGDLRSCIGRLGELSDAKKKLEVSMVEDGAVKKEQIQVFFTMSISGRLKEAYKQYQKMKIENSINQTDLILALEKYIINLKISDRFKAETLVFSHSYAGSRESDIQILSFIGKLHLLYDDEMKRNKGITGEKPA